MKKETLFLIGKTEGFSPNFATLVSMMNYARATTIRAVEELTVEQLDYRASDNGNSIGMLLAHMDAVEKIYQYLTFENVAEEEIERYAETLEPALSLGKNAKIIKGKTAEEYIRNLNQSRSETLNRFQMLPDSWLFEETEWWNGEPANNYFKWFHVFEDELSHRGQIRLIKKWQAESVSYLERK